MRHVQDTLEFRRVRDLPRRTLTPALAEVDAARLTALYGRPGTGAALKHWQGAALAELARMRGLVLQLPVGGGKTHIGELASRVLWPDATAAPASIMIVKDRGLVEKTAADRPGIRAQWRTLHAPPRVVTATTIAIEANADLLWDICPALVVLDEADDFANPDAAVCARLRRYAEDVRSGRVRPKGLPPGAPAEVVFLIMTGTLSRNSIMGYHHLLALALGPEGMPLPRTADEAWSWAFAVDHKGPRGEIGARVGPGPLGENVTAAREWFAARLATTPGVLLIDEDSAAEVPLHIRWVKARECPILDAAYERLLTTGENVAGLPVTDPLAMWRTDMQQGCGYISKWKDPQPPEEWRAARRELAGFTRREIDASQCTDAPLDTPAQVMRAYPDARQVRDWLELEPTYTPVEEIIRISDATIESVGDWLGELPGDEPAIIWCGSVDFAERLAELSGLPYYGRNGREARTKRALHACRGTGRDRIIIVSWHANKRGFNLQPYGRMLFVYPPQSAKWLEQAFGRAHRSGRDRPVHVDFLITSGGTADAFEAAIGEAEFARQTTRLTQKILRAQIERCILPTDESAPNAFRWARKRQGRIATEAREERAAVLANSFPWRGAGRLAG